MKQLGMALLVLVNCMGAAAQTFSETSPAAEHWVDSVYRHLSKKKRLHN